MNKLITALACTLLLQGSVQAADPVRREQVTIAPGEPASKMSAKIKGYASVEYSVAAPANSTLDIKLDSANSSLYFNVSVEGADTAVFVGSRDGNHFTTSATAAARYRVKVYLMRSAARKNQTASYQLTIGSKGV